MLRRILIASAVALPFALSAGTANAGFTWDSDKLKYDWSSTGSASSPDGNLGISYTAEIHSVAAKNGFCNASAWAKVPVTMFGVQKTLFQANIIGSNSGNPGYNFITVAGNVVSDDSFSLNETSNISYTADLASFTTKVTIEGVPITVKITASGKVALSSSWSLSSGDITATMTPSASVNAKVSATVGGTYQGYGVTATLSGSLKVVEMKYPVSATVKAYGSSPPKATITTTRALTLSGLSGSISVNAKAVANGNTILNKTAKVVSWTDGYSKTIASTTDTKTISF